MPEILLSKKDHKTVNISLTFGMSITMFTLTHSYVLYGKYKMRCSASKMKWSRKNTFSRSL